MRFGFHHNHHHNHEGRHAMRGGGRFRRGPFEFSWSMDGEEPGMGRGHGSRRQRVFDGGELKLVLLRLIGDEPRHGYDLIRAIEERTGGAYAPSPGVIYPTLTLLADMGQIEERPSEGNRKLFATTDEGARILAEKAEEIAALMARLETLGEMRERNDNVSIRRAIHNLKSVLMHKLSARDIEQETIHQIVALIDETAQKIERL